MATRTDRRQRGDRPSKRRSRLVEEPPPGSLEADLAAIGGTVSDREWADVPADYFANLDHYPYGAPKKKWGEYSRILFIGARYFTPFDQHRARAIRVRASLGEVVLVTTDEVLTELLDGLAHRGPKLRKMAAQAARNIIRDERVIVCEQPRVSFLGGLDLYEQRFDKGYSLVDCVSMKTMRRLGIFQVLTNDHHFVQEGFRIFL